MGFSFAVDPGMGMTRSIVVSGGRHQHCSAVLESPGPRGCAAPGVQRLRLPSTRVEAEGDHAGERYPVGLVVKFIENCMDEFLLLIHRDVEPTSSSSRNSLGAGEAD